MTTPRLDVALGPLRLENPVLSASGTFGYGAEMGEFFEIDQKELEKERSAMLAKLQEANA